MTPAEMVRHRAELGLPIAAGACSPRTQRALQLADELGAPRGPVLRVAAELESAALALQREVEVAAAGPRAVARGLALLPPVLGPATALLVSDDPFAVWSTPLGHLLGLAAVLGWLSGVLVIHRLVASAGAAGTPDDTVGRDEVLDLLATAVAAGVTVVTAVRSVRRIVGDATLDRLALWLELGGTSAPPRAWAATGPELVTAARDGLPLAGLLRGWATALRLAEQQEALRRAARLEARLALPTTLLLLPAAGLVVAAPLVHGLLVGLGA